MQPVKRLEGRYPPYSKRDWPYGLAAIRSVLNDGLDLPPLTVVVGENGTGKSTLVEAIAMAYGLNAEGGSTHASHRTRQTESDLWKDLRVVRGIGAGRWGFFLRAETMHGFYSYLEDNPGRDPEFHRMSHGESFIEVLKTRFDGPGLYVLDEPESALSFSGCLALAGLLADLTSTGTAQAIVATHSPLLAATPGAKVFEVGSWGLREAAWSELELVQCWRQFMNEPQSFLRHLASERDA